MFLGFELNSQSLQDVEAVSGVLVSFLLLVLFVFVFVFVSKSLTRKGE